MLKLVLAMGDGVFDYDFSEKEMAKRYKPEAKPSSNGCHFGWNTLKEMKENNVQFWAADEYKKLQIVDIDERAKNIYVICRLNGKITWPLNFKRLEEVHAKIHSGEIGLSAYEIEKFLPTWGNYVTGLLRFLGCRSTRDSKNS